MNPDQRSMKLAAKMLLILTLGISGVRGDWPEFRGPTGDGYVPAKTADGKPVHLPLHWSETNNILWKTEIHDRGWCTPVIMNGQVWMTTAKVDGHDFYAVCVDAGTGKIRFDELIFHSDNPESLGNGASMNSYATPSALIEPGRVYVHFGSFGTACLDSKTCKVLWKREDLRCRHYRGPSSSPVSFENLLILTFDGADLQYVIALDKKTGETVWKTNRSAVWGDENVPGQMARDGDLRKAHSTPFIARFGGKPQLVSTGAKAAYGYDPRTGHELWKVHHPDFSVAVRPVANDKLAFLVTGFTKKELWAVKPDGEGDVTDTHVAWKQQKGIGRYASLSLIDGLLYTATDESFISCIDAANGDNVWTERLGGKYAASPVYGEGRLYFCSQDGSTLVLKPGRTAQPLATNMLSGSFMASPAVDGNALYLRTKTHLYRVEEKQ